MPQPITIATWNINSIRAHLPGLLRWLQQENPSILLLQEIKTEHHTFPFEPLEDQGYNIAIHGQKTYNGVAILSKFPLEDIYRGWSQESRYLEAVTNRWRVASVYVPNGRAIDSPHFQFKQQFFKELAERVKKNLPYDEPYIVGGDYNVAPGPHDVYDPEYTGLLCTPEERSWWKALIELGMIDAGIHDINPKPFTWWDYRRGSWPNNKGMRLDHLLLSPYAAKFLESVKIHKHVRSWSKPSDHVPVVVSFNKP